MPRLSDLQSMFKSQNRIADTRFDRNSGEESIVIDERSRHSSKRLVEEKLQRLMLFRTKAIPAGEFFN